MRNREQVKQKALQLLTSGLDATELSMIQVSVTLSPEDKRNEVLKKQAYKEVAKEELEAQKLAIRKKEEDNLLTLAAYVGIHVGSIPSNGFTQSVAQWLQDNGTITAKQEQAIKDNCGRLE
jgi:hypothetical protein